MNFFLAYIPADKLGSGSPWLQATSQVSLILLGPVGPLGHVHLMAVPGAQEESTNPTLTYLHISCLCVKAVGQVKSRDHTQAQ